MLKALSSSKRRKLYSILVLLIALICTATAVCLSRPQRVVSYTLNGLELPLVTLAGPRGLVSFASDPGRLRSTIVRTGSAEGHVIVFDGTRFWAIRRATVDDQHMYIDTAAVFQPKVPRAAPVVIPKGVFGRQSPSRILDSMGVPFREYGLKRTDSISMTTNNGGGVFWLSAAAPFYVSGNSMTTELRLGGNQLGWHVMARDTFSLGATTSRPRVFFVTLGPGWSLTSPAYPRDTTEHLTLVFESAPEIHFFVRFKEAGWVGMAPSHTSELALPALGSSPKTESPVDVLEVRGFETAVFREIRGATLVIGADRDTISFRHTFAVTGINGSVRFTRSEGTRYDGISSNAEVNGENRVRRRLSAIPDEVIAGLVVISLTAVGSLVVWIIRLDS